MREPEEPQSIQLKVETIEEALSTRKKVDEVLAKTTKRRPPKTPEKEARDA